jgi:hypothetical protein
MMSVTHSQMSQQKKKKKRTEGGREGGGVNVTRCSKLVSQDEQKVSWITLATVP